MNTKTLKDLPTYDMESLYPYIKVKTLKAEAIKWIKEDIEGYRKHLGDIVNGKEINSFTMNLINKWKERFNITKEDLK